MGSSLRENRHRPSRGSSDNSHRNNPFPHACCQGLASLGVRTWAHNKCMGFCIWRWLQDCSARDICWIFLTWNPELYRKLFLCFWIQRCRSCSFLFHLQMLRSWEKASPLLREGRKQGVNSDFFTPPSSNSLEEWEGLCILTVSICPYLLKELWLLKISSIPMLQVPGPPPEQQAGVERTTNWEYTAPSPLLLKCS